jgi:hypothetical protein
MNRDAVNAALGLAGNLPLTDADRQYNNLPYVFCRQLYLPVLFASLCALDWRCARKERVIRPPPRHVPDDGRYYYEMPADCVRPLYVDGNTVPFYNDRDLIITEEPASKLYYVFHNRNFNYAALRQPDFRPADGTLVIRAPETRDEYLDGQFLNAEADNGGDEFPEWEYTPYDADFWEYFSYRLAARLVMKLRQDDGAGARAQAMEALADKIGAEAVKRSTAASTNQAPKTLYWHERLGLHVSYSDYRKYKAWK